MLAKIDFLLELIDCPVKLITRVVFEELDKIAIAKGPYIFLHLSVF